MNNNPYGPRKPVPPLEGLEAKFNALSDWGRYGLIGCVGIFFIASCIVTIALIFLSMPSSQPAAAQISAVATTTPSPTFTSTSTPTPEPISAPASTPEQQPASQSDQSQQSASTPLYVTITNAYATDYGPGSVSVNTLPGAALTISVKYCTGSYATTSKLQGTRYADSTGNYTWLWEPETKCRGAAMAYVNASLNGQSASTSTSFTVS